MNEIVFIEPYNNEQTMIQKKYNMYLTIGNRKL